MKRSELFWICLALSMTTTNFIQSTDDLPTPPLEQSKTKTTIQLPISWSSPTQCNLAITIPTGFRSLQPLAKWKESTIIEFIPEGESDSSWSEIITVNKIIGQRISATQITNHLEKTLPTKSFNFEVIASSAVKEPSYLRSNLDVSYDNEGKHEVLSCRYYSGPYDCAGVQYTMRPKPGQSDAETLEKIAAFFEANLQTIDCDSSQP